jgi:hypothetical protein
MPLRCRQRFFGVIKAPIFRGFFCLLRARNRFVENKKKTVLSNLIGPINASELVTVS